VNQDAKVEVKDPKVSVVMTTYNYGRFLGEAIQSVLDQTFQDWELIVVDDGSTDETSEVVASFPDPRIRYIYQQNQGNAAGWNRGIELARGTYIAFLDADDLWLPMKLEKQVAQLDSLPPTVGLVYADLHFFNHEDGAITGRLLAGRSPPRGKVFSQLVRRDWGERGWFIIPTIALIRSEVFQKVGLFDESLRRHQDWEMWVRVAAAYEVDVLNEPLARYRHHAGNVSKDPLLTYHHGVASRLKVLESYSLEPGDRRALLRSLAGLHYGYASIQFHMGNRKEGLQALLTSLRLHPTAFWHYPGAVLMLASPRLYEWLRAGKLRLTQHKGPHSDVMVGKNVTSWLGSERQDPRT